MVRISNNYYDKWASTKYVYYVDYFPDLQIPNFDLGESLLLLVRIMTNLILVGWTDYA